MDRRNARRKNCNDDIYQVKTNIKIHLEHAENKVKQWNIVYYWVNPREAGEN